MRNFFKKIKNIYKANILFLYYSSILPQSAIEKIKSKKIYALEGNNGAGKTIILKIIAKNFKDIEFVEEPINKWQNLGGMNLLDSFYSNPQRWGFAFEFYTMLTEIEALLKVADSEKSINYYG